MNIITFGTDINLLDIKSRQFARLARYAVRLTSLTIIVLSNRGVYQVEQKNMTCILLSWKHPVLSFKKLNTVFKLFSNKDNTIVSTQDPFEMGLIGLVFAKFLHAAFHVQIHTAVFSKFFRYESFRSFFQYCISFFVLKFANSIRVVNDELKKELIKKGYDEKYISVCPIIEELPTKIKTSQYVFGEKIKILCVARAVYFKNIPILLSAFKKVQSVYSVNLTIIGGGPLTNFYKKLIKKYQLEDSVTLLEWTNNIEEHYLSSDVFVLPSLYEGFGMVVVESLGYGLPVVVTPFGGAASYVKKGVNGAIAQGFTSNELYVAIMTALETVIYKNPLDIRASLDIPTQEEVLQKLCDSWALALERN